MGWGEVIGAGVNLVGGILGQKKAAKAADKAAKANSPVAQANAQMAVNNHSQYTPYGSSTWQVTGQNPDGTNIYSNTQTLSPEMQRQFDLGNINTEQNLYSQGNYLNQIEQNSNNPLSASNLRGQIDYGPSAQDYADYAGSMHRSAGNAQTMGDYSPVDAQGYSANTYQGKGYNANTYQGQGYNANTYQGQGYNANTYNPVTAGQAAQAGVSHAAYGNIQNDAYLPADQFSGDADKVRTAYYNQQRAMLDPQWEQDQRAMETKLANQGVAINSEAYNNAMDAFNRNRTFAYNNAQNNAITQGGSEQSRLFNMALQQGQFHNQAQQQGFDQSAWNAGADNAASLSNAQMQNAMNQFNANAYNQAGQYNTSALNQAAEYGANATNQANQYNAGAMNQADQYTANAANQANQYNTGAMNQAAEYGANAENQANQYNAGAMNQADQYTANALNQMNQYNAGMRANYGQYNANANNQMNQFNANLNNTAAQNVYNARLSQAQQNNDAVNQEMAQLFAFRNQPINEYNSLRQGTSMVNPQFSNTQGANVNMAQAMQQNAAMQTANANNQALGNAQLWNTAGNVVANTDWSKLFNFGGNGGSASDYSGDAMKAWIAKQ